MTDNNSTSIFQKGFDWVTEISKVARCFTPSKADRYSWRIIDFPVEARVVRDCNLSTSNGLVLDRDWYIPGYKLLIKNFDSSKAEVHIIEKVKLDENQTLYTVIDIHNTGICILTGAKVVADYLDPDTEAINNKT